MMNLNYIKSYLRIDFDDDDSYLSDLINISKNFIKEQTGVDYSATDLVYNQALLFMIAHYYENKTSFSEKSISQVPYTLDCMVKHIGMRGAINEQ